MVIVLRSTLTAALNQPKRLWGTYMKHLDASPLSTKAFTSVVAATLGDSLAQHISKPEGDPEWSYDWARTFRLALFNGGFMAPLGHHYYGALDRKVFPLTPTSPNAVISKVAIDQLLFAPVCTVFFYAYKCFIEGRSKDFIPELKQKWAPTVIAGYALWPAAHVINFLFVPTQQRILYANVVSVAGTYILSRAAAGDYNTTTTSTKNVDEKKRKKNRHAGEYGVVLLDTVVDVSRKHEHDE